VHCDRAQAIHALHIVFTGLVVHARVARFFLVRHTKTGENTKYTKWPQNIPNGRKTGIPSGNKIYQYLLLQAL
jgi:hypothetical protein